MDAHSHRSRHPGLRSLAIVCAWVIVLALPVHAAAQDAATLYQRATARAAAARDLPPPALSELRTAARAYENIVRRYWRSGYCDNALWEAAGLMTLAWQRSGAAQDRQKAEEYLVWLRDEYPHSKLVDDARAKLRDLDDAAARPSAPAGPATVQSVSRTALPRGDRLTIELTHEVAYRGDRVENPDRLFFDFSDSEPASALADLVQGLDGRLVTEVRIGRHPNRVTRVVFELEGTPKYSAFLMYDPFRLVVDLESDALEPVEVPVPDPSQSAPPEAAEPVGRPDTPASTRDGDYSLSRQLGLSVSRIVIDAGHGGHDPGARANGLIEKELVLDIARRLETLLTEHPGVSVVLTRGSDQFVALEERTAIANREGADLFLSIHANSSPRSSTRGIETYVLNFATNAEAEAVAARENASSTRAMGTLPELVKTIALNDKLAESRELATMVQTALVRSLRTQSTGVKDLGVKQAPFVVLIGAEMPSVLAEISFLTNKPEADLLKQSSYRQRIAQALHDAVVKYQSSLKKITVDPQDDGSR